MRRSFARDYNANGQRIAARVNDELYYTLPDPTGASLLLLDEAGNETGRILYDAYGGVLAQQLTPDLEAALSGQGALADPATGLALGDLGSGRWYDPALGLPLQPSPAGGPPTVPQALNRYAATPVGQPGVAEGVTNSGFSSFARQQWLAPIIFEAVGATENRNLAPIRTQN